MKKKLMSSDGASLILSMLVFLLCVMVAASVLAAAVSNAGKAGSSRVEQQRYQTLSSALRLICGELEKVEYIGKYEVSTWEKSDIEYFFCRQLCGEFKMQDAYESQSFRLADNAVFPFMKDVLTKEMDEVFRRQFQKGDESGDAKDGYGPLLDGDVIAAEAAPPIRLTVTLPENLAGYPYATGAMAKEYGIPRTVNIEIVLDHDTRNIKVTAWLDDTGNPPSGGSGIMAAELAADADLVPKIQDPEDPDTGTLTGANIPSGVTPPTKSKTIPVKWKLEGIKITTAP